MKSLMKTLLLVLLCAALALAQNPNTAVFSPSSTAAPTDHDLGVATFRASSTLAGDITSSSVSLDVATGEGSRFKAGNYIVIGSEVIAVYGVSGDTLAIGKSSSGNVDGRGIDGTTAAAHLTGVAVSNYNAPSYVNQAAAEIKAIAGYLSTDRYCADAGANDTYTCSLSPSISSYVTGRHYFFKANTANTGAATINLNSVGAKTIKKVAGGVTTDLADNDIRAGQIVDLVYDGTNMQMQSLLGNAPSVTGGTCTNQAATAISTAGVPTCTTLTSAYVNTSIAQTGVDINTSHQVTATHLASPLPVAQGGTANAFFTVSGPASTAKTYTFPNASANILTDNALVTAAQGGTANGFFAVSGPTTSTKTFTFPNASATVLTDNALVTAAQGGTANGFFAVSGPTTSTKTFTFPNASATVLTSNAAVTIAQGGTGTASTLTGLVRGSASAMTAAELSGDISTSGSNVTAIGAGKVTNTMLAGSIDLASKVTGILPAANNTVAVLDGSVGYCADAGSNDTYACSLSPAPAGYVTGARYRFKAATANTGAATLNLNSLGAKTIKKAAGGVTTDLSDNDIRAGQVVEVVYDGTNLQMQSTLGNAASGSGNVSVTTGTADPSGACTAGQDQFLNTAASPPELWFCSVSGTWQKILSTLNSGAFSLIGQMGSDPSTPATGYMSVGANSTSKIVVAVDDDGAKSYTTRALSAVSNHFVTGLGTDGILTHAQPAFSNLSGTATTSQLPGTGATTVNGQTCTLGSSCTIPLSAVNAQTSTYQVLAADFSNYKTITVASGTFTITLVASGSQPAAGQYIRIVNYGSGVVTIARSGQNINGGTSSLTLGASSATAPTSAIVQSDATNYFASVAVPGVTGGTCTNQATTAISTSGVPTCTTITSSYVNNTIALTGTDINTSNQVTATHLASALPVNQGGTGTTSTLTGLVRGSGSAMTAAELSGDATTSGSNAVVLASKYKIWSCQSGIGDGLNAIPAGTYLQSFCYNDTGATVTLTGLKCLTDNSGSSTMNATDGSASALLTGAITCSTSWAAGTQSGTTTIASGGYIKFTFVADGTSKQSSWVVTGTR